MLIGIDASRYGHETATGVERYSFYIINGLIEKISREKEHEIVLYSRKPLKIPASLVHDRKYVKFKIIPREKFWTQLGLAREMTKSPPDRLFVPSHTLPRKHPEKSVIMIHDIAFKYLRKSYSLKEYLYQDLSTRFACKRAWQILVPSECTKNDLIRFYKCPANKIHVVYHGYEPLPELCMSREQEEKILNQFGLKLGEKFVFFIGRLETKKNIENLLKAFMRFSKKHKDWKLLLGGKRGTGFDRIMKIADEFKVWDNVLMPGYIHDVEKYVLFKNCKFFIFPSLYEGFGFPILEAFSHGKPVLTSRVSAIPEVAGDAAMYTDPFDSEIMAKDIEKLALNEQLQIEFSKKSAKRLEKFHWDHAVEQTYRILTM